MKETSRIIDTKKVPIQEGSKIVRLSDDELTKKYGIHKIIRLHPTEFRRLPKAGLFTHFNLQSTSHKKGQMYALVKIVKAGYFDGKKEILPVITFKEARVGLCIDAKNNMPYDKLKEDDFRYSLPNIKNVNSLKYAILRRYKKSMAHLSDEEKLSMGVAITRLKIIKVL